MELKRIRWFFTEVRLLESRVHRGIGNLAKAKVSVWGGVRTSIPLSYTLQIHRLPWLLRGRLPTQYTVLFIFKPLWTSSLVYSMPRIRTTPLHSHTSMRLLRTCHHRTIPRRWMHSSIYFCARLCWSWCVISRLKYPISLKSLLFLF